MATPTLSRLRWYAARASAMPPREWLHRAGAAAQSARDRGRGLALPDAPAGQDGWPRPAGAAVLVDDRAVAEVLAMPDSAAAAHRRAEPLSQGRVAFFGHGEFQLPSDPDWHTDAPTGERWPQRHWSTIDHRRAVADPKWIWELGRHQHVLQLARAWRLTGDERFAATAGRHLRSFLAQNPPGIGIHWRVGLEVGMRLITWAWTVDFLRGSPVASADLLTQLRRSVAAHLEHLRRYPSLFSSANNHLIGELAGAAVGGMAFPEVPGATAAVERALPSLAQELERQLLTDGVNAEQAVAYQGFVLDLCLAVAACAHRSGRRLPAGMADSMARTADALGVMASDAYTLPRIGDDDDAVGIDLASGMDEPARLRSRLRSAALLTGMTLQRHPGGMDEQTVWLCGAQGPRTDVRERHPGSAVLPAGGYAVLRERDPAAGEVRAVLKAGPFGLPPLHAHGHADLLSVCVSVAGEEALIDPGPISYYGNPDHRAYARSTRAHSTVRVDGRDQATPDGAFLWLRPPRAHLTGASFDEHERSAQGHHDAYAPVRHERRVELAGGVLTVTDRVFGPPRPHRLELLWHFAPGVVAPQNDGWRWTGARASLAVSVAGIDGARIVEGSDDPPLGWSSRRLEHRQPSPTLVLEGELTLPATLVTQMTPVPR